MSVIYLPGTWTDVCVLPDGLFAQITTDGPTVRCFVEGVLFWQRDAPIAVGQCRAASTPRGVLSIHQGNKQGDPDDGVAFLIGEHSVTRLGLTFGAQSVAIDSEYAYIVRSNQHYERVRLSDGHVDENLPHGVPGSGQGFRDVGVWADNAQVDRAGGLTLHQITRVGFLAIGQADPPQIAGFNFSTIERFTAIEGEAYEPHAVRSGNQFAICARTPKGAAFVVVPPFPAFVAGAPTPIPVPVPQPKPEEPKPVSIQLPQNVKSTRDAFVAKFPIPQMVGSGPSDDAFENKCRAWVLHLAETVAALDDESYGVKNAGGGRPQSKDSLAHQVGGRLINFDLLSGVGTGHPSLVADPQGEDITGQTFMPVAAINWLAVGPDTLPTGGGPAPQEPAPPAPTVPADYERRLKAVEEAVSAIEAANREERIAVAALGEALRMLGERPAPTYRATGTTSRDYGHSHRINVTLEQVK